MPIHDWTRMQPGDFHHFHQRWIQDIAAALNSGLLPPEYMALAEQDADHPTQIERTSYAQRADHIILRHGQGRGVAIIEIVSPGNKASRGALRTFVEKATGILNQGMNLLVVDLFPPTSCDSRGVHEAIWDELEGGPCELPSDKPLTLAAYVAGELVTAYVEPLRVGDVLPPMPLFLSRTHYIPAPREATYQQAWVVFPAVLKKLLEGE